ncbi:MAG: hypothetical protein OEL68_10280, partial [Desulfobulbaceae bacterium]|nr:hypothetical protein [Desulfobulbaceae bacterium]
LKIVRQQVTLPFRHVPCTLTNRADFLIGALAVTPCIVFLGAAPFHIAGTGSCNLFFSVALRTDLLGFSGHNRTSIIAVARLYNNFFILI